MAAGTQVVLLMHYYGQRDEVRDASAKLDGVRSATSLETGRKVGYWTDAHKFDPGRWIVDGTFDPNAGRASGCALVEGLVGIASYCVLARIGALGGC